MSFYTRFIEPIVERYQDRQEAPNLVDILMSLDDDRYTLKYQTVPHFSEGPYGPTTLGEYIGRIEQCRVGISYRGRRYNLKLNQYGKVCHNEIYWHNKQDKSDCIMLSMEQAERIEKVLHEKFILAKLEYNSRRIE